MLRFKNFKINASRVDGRLGSLGARGGHLMGGFWAAWALLAAAPGPFKPEARNGFPSGNVSSIPETFSRDARRHIARRVSA